MVWYAKAALLGAVIALAGCGTLRNLFGGSSFEMPQSMPLDFQFRMERRGAKPPDVDYLYKFERNGRVEYWVKDPSPSAKPNSGSFEVESNALFAFYDLIREKAYQEIDPDGGEPLSEQRIDGELNLWVYAGGNEKTVTFRNVMVPVRAKDIYDAAFKLIPEKYRSAEAPRDMGKPDRFVGDKMTKTFYPSDYEKLDEEVPPERRVFFATPHEALDHGYFPDPVSKPLERYRDSR